MRKIKSTPVENNNTIRMNGEDDIELTIRELGLGGADDNFEQQDADLKTWMRSKGSKKA